jgi:hypothetical protein
MGMTSRVAGPHPGLDALVRKALELKGPVGRPLQVFVLPALQLPSLVAAVEAGDHRLQRE